MKPLCIELFAGLHGWGAAFAAEGYRVVGFDIADMSKFCGQPKPAGCQLVLQDVLTLHGSQFRDAAVIVASPPCQNYSYLAMPWSRSKSGNSQKAKAMRRKWETEGPDNRLFDACFRIQREAIEATRRACPVCLGHPGRLWTPRWEMCVRCKGKAIVTRYIPLIVENVRGAQPWVGKAKANFGSYYLWGDVAMVGKRIVAGVPEFGAGMHGASARKISVSGGGMPDANGNWPGSWFTREASGMTTQDEYRLSGQKANPDGTAHPQGSWFRIADSSHGDRGQKVPAYSDPRRNGGKGVHLTSPAENADGTKIGGDWFSDPASTCRRHGSRSSARKIASAMIARIPYDLAAHIARVYKPAPAC